MKFSKPKCLSVINYMQNSIVGTLSKFKIVKIYFFAKMLTLSSPALQVECVLASEA